MGIVDGIVEGRVVGSIDGVELGPNDLVTVGIVDGIVEGRVVGSIDGVNEGSAEGISDGLLLGSILNFVGVDDGRLLGSTDGNADGARLEARIDGELEIDGCRETLGAAVASNVMFTTFSPAFWGASLMTA